LTVNGKEEYLRVRDKLRWPQANLFFTRFSGESPKELQLSAPARLSKTSMKLIPEQFLPR
jgi:hypothetical protein